MTKDRARAVLVTGAPGVGKSEVAMRIADALPGQVAVIDLDALGSIKPWRSDPDVLQLIAANFASVLDEYLRWGQRSFVVVGVMMPGKLHDAVVSQLDRQGVEYACYGLTAAPGVLEGRIRGDGRFRDRRGRLADLPLNEQTPLIPGVVLIDTTELRPVDVAARIVGQESVRSLSFDPSTRRAT